MYNLFVNLFLIMCLHFFRHIGNKMCLVNFDIQKLFIRIVEKY